ncbi:TetR/AcrR family transcriptional regulator [Corallincola spongiicola]|uniref:TetR/AcrR family transcriptional regulator n=1 Tax=Corallincola spongiicola TaxID=2520508 RepID=A0ABY1WQ47_9GAMM|nr:TetR/AcrR family transcriptional regulator [Corallincola spongiicola]TAA46846.1 TetR/AcrR family transcriptional regulator [Corallincola spongiicola]
MSANLKPAPRSIHKRQRILDAALTLFIEQGFHGTSTAAIAKHAGVATGTLFHHFASKEALINALYLAVKAELAEGIAAQSLSLSGQPSSQQLRTVAKQFWQHSLCWCVSMPEKVRFFAQYNHSPYINNQTQQTAQTQVFGFINGLLRVGQQQAVFKCLPVELLYETCHGLLLQTAFYYISQRRMPTEIECDQSFGLLWDALHA